MYLKVHESDQLVSKVRLQYVLVSSGETRPLWPGSSELFVRTADCDSRETKRVNVQVLVLALDI